MLPYFLLAFMAAANSGFRSVEVDAGRVTGKIRSFQGVNGGPLSLAPNGPDYTRQYKELRIVMIRNDYFGPLDIDARWPDPDRIARAVHASADKTTFPNWSADPEKPESYNFGPGDRIIEAIVHSGADVYYRIGRSWAADPTPPDDFDKYANIVRHVAMHYNAGWAHGFHDDIRYWEFWNEPDAQRAWNPQFIRPFWSGTPQQFYTLYEKVARALKSVDPQMKVGGPGKAASDIPGPYREGFIEYCAAHKVPLDFYSWHHYHGPSLDPYDMVRVGQIMRKLLDSNGFRNAETYASEWNMGPGLSAGGVTRPPMQAAAFAGAVLTYLQDSALQRAMYYRGEAGPRPFFDADGTFRKYAYAFMAAGGMLDTPDRLAVTGADTFGFAVLAGRSADNSKVRIMISNYEMPLDRRPPRMQVRLQPQPNVVYRDNRGYALKIANLPWGDAAFTVKRYQLSDSDDFTPQNLPAGRGSTFELSRELAPPGLELIVLERQR
jgi:xylan 1,4-beta-xylosidase